MPVNQWGHPGHGRSGERRRIAVDRRQPRSLLIASEGGRALCAQLGEVPGHRVADAHRVSPFGEPLPAVLGERLQLREPQPATHRNGDHQRLVDQGAEAVGHVGRADVIVAAHRLCPGEVTTAREHGQPFEDELLLLEEQLVAPVDDGPQRLVAGQNGA